MKEDLKKFYLFRKEDASGVSGTGVVAYGVVFPSGKAVIEWCTYHSSIGIYSNVEDVSKIHGHGGATELIYLTDGESIDKMISKKKERRK
jgi:hypothetical protein